MKFPVTFLVQLLFAVCIVSCSSENKKENREEQSMPDKVEVITNTDDEKQHAESKPASTANIEVKTFLHSNEDHTEGYGYDIIVDGKLYIHQPHIPAVSGNHSFKTDADAKKAGELAAYKIRNKIMPPSITVEELDSLGIK
jgi:Domain of unknown function (DUF4907)